MAFYEKHCRVQDYKNKTFFNKMMLLPYCKYGEVSKLSDKFIAKQRLPPMSFDLYPSGYFL